MVNEGKEEVKKTSKKVIVFNILFIIAIFIGIFIYMMNTDGSDNIGELLRTANYGWVAGGLICLIISWIAEAFTIHIPLKRIYPGQRFLNSFKLTMIGQLFNNITPFSSGGQIMQTYEMNQDGKRTSDSLSVLMMKFIVMQVTLILFTGVILVSQFKFFTELFQTYWVIGLIGIVMNLILLTLLLASGSHKEFVMKIARPIIKLISKIHIGKFRFIKDPEEKLEHFDKSVENFSQQFKMMKTQKRVVIKMIIAGIIQNAAYYGITYMVYRTFGNSGVSYFHIVARQAFLWLLITIIPTPGSSLGIEGGFLLLFSPIFKGGTINISILVWRIYTFYLPIIIGALAMIPTGKHKITKRKEEEKAKI